MRPLGWWWPGVAGICSDGDNFSGHPRRWREAAVMILFSFWR
jgi:hypothetical protein